MSKIFWFVRQSFAVDMRTCRNLECCTLSFLCEKRKEAILDGWNIWAIDNTGRKFVAKISLEENEDMRI